MEEDTEIDIIGNFDTHDLSNDNLGIISSGEISSYCSSGRILSRPQSGFREEICMKLKTQQSIMKSHSTRFLKTKRKRCLEAQFYQRKKDHCQGNVEIMRPLKRSLILSEADEDFVIITKMDGNQDEDMEIDVEGDTNNSSSMENQLQNASMCKFPTSSGLESKSPSRKRNEPPVNNKYMESLQERMNNVYNLPHPTEEIKMDQTQISEEEQALFPEFFSSMKASLINRYLKIRSHILDCWIENKHLYLTITQIKNCLKNCGDVNLITRVYAYLEMKGAINFGCEQCSYLQKVKLSSSEECDRLEENNEESNKDWATSVVDKNWKPQLSEISPAIGFGEGGLTLMHDDDGSITKIIISKHEETNDTFNSSLNQKDEKRQLIYCKRFTSEECVPFQLCFYLEALLVAEVHCYSSDLAAAKGFFLGWHDADRRVLHVTDCAPIAATGLTTCDWKSNSFSLNNQQFIVGWYFSHPISKADSSVINQPMHTDLRALFTKKASDPFFMMALSPYSCSKKKCITTVKGSPYFINFKTVLSEDLCIVDVIKKMKEAISKGNHEVQFNKKCELLNNKTYGQLCYESIRRLLDSTVKAVPSGLKEELIMATKYLVGFNNFID